MDDLALRLFRGDEPTLDHDVFIDSCPDQRGAEEITRRYASLLLRHGLDDRFGVYKRRMNERGQWGIYIGPHDSAETT